MKLSPVRLFVACLGLAWLALPAAAQTIQPIYSFTNNGSGPSSPSTPLTLGPDGNFYGTTGGGGSNDYGTVFRITTNGTLTVLVNFGDTNGAQPAAGLMLGPDGNFYGTTGEGGSTGNGTVFQMTADGVLTTLASFGHTNGAYPEGALALGPDGNFYGTTAQGGSTNLGTVFRITTGGSLTMLASFGVGNGASPTAGLTLGPDGNFYGTTYYGGHYDGNRTDGTVFRITTNGTLTTLVTFGHTNGANPGAALTLGPDGNFYGTTQYGGNPGPGTVFRITTNGILTTLASFNVTNGYFPLAALTLASDGNFYSTTYFGGNTNGSAELGTVFRITTNGTLTSLAIFSYYTNGANPEAGLTLGPDGNLYGTASEGGPIELGVIYPNNAGVVFRLNLPPSIITQPSNQIVAVGGNATFTVTLFGTAPFAYQWFSNGAPIASATNSTLDISNVTPSSAGNYQVMVTTAWGSVTSIVATLSLPISPTITNQPTNETLPIGGTANFAVGATGTPPLAYQWYFDTNTALTAGTNATLSIGPVLTNQAGQYQVIVSNPYGSATSSAAELTVLLQPNCYGISNNGSGTVTLLLASTPGSTNRLWATTNLELPLAQWQPITTNTADPTGFFQFIDTNNGEGPAKFYILSSP